MIVDCRTHTTTGNTEEEDENSALGNNLFIARTENDFNVHMDV